MAVISEEVMVISQPAMSRSRGRRASATSSLLRWRSLLPHSSRPTEAVSA